MEMGLDGGTVEPLVQLFLNAGVAGGLAAFVMWTLSRDTQQRIADERERSEQERSDKLQMLDVVRRNTEVLAELNTLIRARKTDSVAK